MSLFWAVLGVILLSRKHNFWGIVLIIIGITGFLSGVFHINIGSIILPVLFIAWGVSILFRKDDICLPGNSISGESKNDFVKESVVFASLNRKYTSKEFKGGKIETVFGGFKIDLTDAKIAKTGAVITVNAVFGGGEIIVPQTMRISSQGSGLMGGWQDKFTSTADKDSPELIIKGDAVFGGVEIKN